MTLVQHWYDAGVLLVQHWPGSPPSFGPTLVQLACDVNATHLQHSATCGCRTCRCIKGLAAVSFLLLHTSPGQDFTLGSAGARQMPERILMLRCLILLMRVSWEAEASLAVTPTAEKRKGWILVCNVEEGELQGGKTRVRRPTSDCRLPMMVVLVEWAS